MSSSYELFLRRESGVKIPNMYDVYRPPYLTTWGICPTGWTTYLINNGTDARICVKEPPIPSSAPRCEQPIKKYRFPETRHNAQFDMKWYDKRDYGTLPFKYDGTGYQPTLGLKVGENVFDNYDVDPKRDEYRLIQPYLMKKATEKRRSAQKVTPICAARDIYPKCNNLSEDPHYNYFH